METTSLHLVKVLGVTFLYVNVGDRCSRSQSAMRKSTDPPSPARNTITRGDSREHLFHRTDAPETRLSSVVDCSSARDQGSVEVESPHMFASALLPSVIQSCTFSQVATTLHRAAHHSSGNTLNHRCCCYFSFSSNRSFFDPVGFARCWVFVS